MTIARRRFIVGAGCAAVGMLAARSRATASPPKESGLSSEGLLVGHDGFQPRTTMPLPHDEIPGFLSRQQLAASHARYAQQAARLREIDQALRSGVADPARYAELRKEQVQAANATLLHELYFTGLALAKVEPPRSIRRHLDEHMGPLESWQEDFRRCAHVAKAWAALVYDPYDDRWHDVAMDSDGDGMWIGANPLVVCDVSEHAYTTDYPRREDYVDRFLEHVDWEEVARRYKAVDRM